MLMLQIQIKDVYGESKAYPVNTNAQLLARIAGTKTLTQAALANALAMGMAIQVVDRYGQVCRSYTGKQSMALVA